MTAVGATPAGYIGEKCVCGGRRGQQGAESGPRALNISSGACGLSLSRLCFPLPWPQPQPQQIIPSQRNRAAPQHPGHQLSMPVSHPETPATASPRSLPGLARGPVCSSDPQGCSCALSSGHHTDCKLVKEESVTPGAVHRGAVPQNRRNRCWRKPGMVWDATKPGPLP